MHSILFAPREQLNDICSVINLTVYTINIQYVCTGSLTQQIPTEYQLCSRSIYKCSDSPVKETTTSAFMKFKI